MIHVPLKPILTAIAVAALLLSAGLAYGVLTKDSRKLKEIEDANNQAKLEAISAAADRAACRNVGGVWNFADSVCEAP